VCWWVQGSAPAEIFCWRGVCEDAGVGVEIVRLDDARIGGAGAVLARAFHDDPLMTYAIPDPAERARLLPDVYARMIRFGHLAGEVHATAGTLEGVAVWMPPHAKWTRENIEASGMHQMRFLFHSTMVLDVLLGS